MKHGARAIQVTKSPLSNQVPPGGLHILQNFIPGLHVFLIFGIQQFDVRWGFDGHATEDESVGPTAAASVPHVRDLQMAAKTEILVHTPS